MRQRMRREVRRSSRGTLLDGVEKSEMDAGKGIVVIMYGTPCDRMRRFSKIRFKPRRRQDAKKQSSHHQLLRELRFFALKVFQGHRGDANTAGNKISMSHGLQKGCFFAPFTPLCTICLRDGFATQRAQKNKYICHGYILMNTDRNQVRALSVSIFFIRGETSLHSSCPPW